MYIALDAMGSDRGPKVVARGGFLALRDMPDLQLTLVGDAPMLAEFVDAEGSDVKNRITIEGTKSVIGMNESPVEALKVKKDSSLIRAVQLVVEGKCQAIISAGSTGAQVAASTLMMRTLPGVRRAGIGTLLPSKKGKVVLVDVGANPNCKGYHLAQYGVMGALYAKSLLNLESPRVALLSIGSERSKGNLLTKEAHDYLSAAPIEFVGNIEGHEIFNGVADVIVCDGFIGNIVLKVAEGMAESLFTIFHQACEEAGVAKEPGFLKAFQSVRSRIDWEEVGGAQLLGTNGVSVIAHGRSTEAAILNAIKTGYRLVEAGLNAAIVESFSNEEAVAN